MAEKFFVTRAQLDAIAAGLSKLKKKQDERFTLKAGVIHISAKLTETLAKGFSYPDIAEILKREHNITINPATLASYHRAAGSSNGGAATPGTNGHAGKATTASGDDSAPAKAATLPLDKPGNTGGKFIQDPTL